MIQYTKYDGIVEKIKLELESESSIFNISKKLNIDSSLVYQVCVYYNLRPHIHLQGRPKINKVYNLRILNKDKTLRKCDICKIMGISYDTLNNYLDAYNIEDVNKYKRRIAIELLELQELSLNEISEITKFTIGTLSHIQTTLEIDKLSSNYTGIKRRVNKNTGIGVDIKTINKCKRMLRDINISKKKISETLGLSKRQINVINNKYKIRGYKTRPSEGLECHKTIINLLKSRQHTVKEICMMVGKSETVVRSVMKENKIEPLQQYLHNKIIDRLANSDMTMSAIAREVGYAPSVISNINKKYNIRKQLERRINKK